MLGRLASRRLAAWCFFAPAASFLFAFVLLAGGLDRRLISLGMAPFVLLAAPRWLYLGTRLRPRGGVPVWIAAIVAAASVIPILAVALAYGVGLLTIDLNRAFAVVLTVPSVILTLLVARAGHGDPALPWLPAVAVAALLGEAGEAVNVVWPPETRTVPLAGGLVLAASAIAILFLLGWNAVVGRRLLREELAAMAGPPVPIAKRWRGADTLRPANRERRRRR